MTESYRRGEFLHLDEAEVDKERTVNQSEALW
jgi:hypothetical protein